MKQLPQNATVGDLAKMAHWRQFSHFRDRMLAVVLRRKGKTVRDIAATLHRSKDFVQRWNDRYRRQGARGLQDKILPLPITRLHGESRLKFRERILAGPTAADAVSAFRRSDMQKILAHEFDVTYSLTAISYIVHRSYALKVPSNMSLLHLPPYSPELNPVERLWFWLKDRYLSNRVYSDLNSILDAGQQAWKKITQEVVRAVCRAD